MLNKKIIFVGGGNMAEGIIRGIINTNTMKPEQITVSEIIPQRRDYLKETYNIAVVASPMQVIKDADIIFLAVRPQNAEESVKEICSDLKPNQILISICAGIDLSRLNLWTDGHDKIARVMPNVLIEARHGYSGVCVAENISEDDKSIITELLSAIGQTMFIPENLFNEFTAYSCAGPAYIMYFLAAVVDAGVEAGFSRKDALAMAIENLIGAGIMVEKTKKHPYQITDTMTSPAGVTIEGCHVLSKSGFHGIVMDAIRAAVKRSNEF